MTQSSATGSPVTERPGSSERGRRLLILALISAAQLMITLDSTIVSVALPNVQRAIGLSNADRQWALTAYTLAFGGLLLLGGRIGDLIGRKRTMLIGVAGFAAASALGGAAVNGEMLIGARALQGVFAAFIAPSTLALVTATFTEVGERARALSIYTAAMMTGGGLGLLLGGLLTTYLGWRWCLYVNVPLAALVVPVGLRLVPGIRGDATARLDLPGALLSSGGMLALIYALGEAGTYGWGSNLIVGTLALAAVLLSLFVWWQSRAAGPLLPLRVLTNRDSAVAFLSFVISAFCTYGMLLGMTYQFQEVMRYSPLRAGLAFLAYVATAVIWSTQVAARLVRRVKSGHMIAGGLLVFAGALLLLTRLSPDTGYLRVLPALILFGVGVGTITVPAMTTVVTVNDPRDQGVFSAIVNSAQQTGASVGAALLNTISVGAAAAFLTAHAGESGVAARSMVHGLAVASQVSAVVAVAGAVLAALAIRVDTRSGATRGR